jgi:phospholipase C
MSGGGRRAAVAVLALSSAGTFVTVAHGSPPSAYGLTANPIKHVVVIFQETHTFDSMLGGLCRSTTPPRCNGAVTGTTSSGRVIRL